MSGHNRRHAATIPSTEQYAADSGSVPRPRRLPPARSVGLAIGVGRTLIGASFLAAPVTALRVLGVDSATAARTSWLSRMTAARDGVLGAGTLMSAATGRGAAPWLVAGAVADVADAAVIAAAVRSRRLGGVVALGMVGAAGAAAAAGLWAAAAAARRG
ncbi:MAG: hypothetical protein M3N95_18420 [Actinomycetota bacterium]|nr:hypothetical protein [Actinomycetota bacterium]